MSEKSIKKKSLLANNKYVVLDRSSARWQLLANEEEVHRWHEDGSLSDGDIVIELTPETVKVAELKKFLELK